jgi:hypothetical protein
VFLLLWKLLNAYKNKTGNDIFHKNLPMCSGGESVINYRLPVMGVNMLCNLHTFKPKLVFPIEERHT